ncbi:MAG: LysM peptidoglycan-binding domain-containing protein [Chloroflexi bacterium]|nr:LysM peptidoglycan-binding domain-containing protein [Chloroflexota bacterium]
MSARRRYGWWIALFALFLLAGCVRAKPPRQHTLSPDLFPASPGAPGRTQVAQAYPLPAETPTPGPPSAIPTVSPVATPTFTSLPGTPTPTPSLTLVPSSPTPTVTIEITPTMTPVPLSPTATQPTLGDVTYTVLWGDNLTGIARRFGVSVEAIMAKNGLRNPNAIFVGQTLVIPLGYEPQVTSTPQLTQHLVRPGENLSQIARRYHTSVAEILAQNPGLGNPNRLIPGTLLTVPVNTQAPPLTHRVRYGETLSSIARRYGVSVRALIQANGLSDPNQVFVGQVLVIPR